MEIKYMSFDGKYFDKPEDCLAHEKNNPLFKMWGENGVTANPEEAFVVHLIKDIDGAKSFVALCEREDINHNGIDSYNDAGFYLWDEWGSCWVSLSEETINTLRSMFEGKAF